MIKKTITYKTYDGETVTGTYYFNLNKRDQMKLQVEHPGGLLDYLNKIIKAEDMKSIFEVIEEVVQLSYGVKSADGVHHVKNAKVLEDFVSTEAYSELVYELATNAEAAAEFVNGIVPVEGDNDDKVPASVGA